MDPALPPVETDPEGPIRLDVECPDGSIAASRTLSRPFAVLGRDSGADLVVDAPKVSRRHAYFQAIGGRVFCTDLQTRGGTHWADGPRPWGWVDPGSGVLAGGFLIRPRGAAEGPPPGASGGDDPRPSPATTGPRCPRTPCSRPSRGRASPSSGGSAAS